MRGSAEEESRVAPKEPTWPAKSLKTKDRRADERVLDHPTWPSADCSSMQILDNERLIGGEGGIRTHVPVTRQDAFEAPPLRPLRYLSVESDLTRHYSNEVWDTR